MSEELMSDARERALNKIINEQAATNAELRAELASLRARPQEPGELNYVWRLCFKAQKSHLFLEGSSESACGQWHAMATQRRVPSSEVKHCSRCQWMKDTIIAQFLRNAILSAPSGPLSDPEGDLLARVKAFVTNVKNGEPRFRADFVTDGVLAIIDDDVHLEVLDFSEPTADDIAWAQKVAEKLGLESRGPLSDPLQERIDRALCVLKAPGDIEVMRLGLMIESAGAILEGRA